MQRFRQFAVLISLLAVAAAPLFAGDDSDRSDPPSRVARLSYISGKISVQPGGVDDWVTASVNRPLTTYDRVWADKDSRAELNLGTAAIRINSETSLGLSNVSDSTVQLELFQGTLNLRVSHLYDGEIYEVDTPNMAFTILKSGSYRFDVNADNDYSLVTVWKGEGEATGDGPAVRVRAHEMMRFTRDRSLVHIRSGEPDRDGFDDWCRVRDRREDGASSLRYVARGTIGYEDLDGYGSWVYVSPYGWVWQPVVSVGWAPYRYGHWTWVSPWGWTWVDNEPWGFAPFHYGRWVFWRSRWSWCPGPRYYRPYYAPALVAWVGGSHWGVSIGFGGGVGWFPLGWGDPYFPYYRHSRGYFRNVNVYNTRINNITYITNNYYNNDRGPRWRYRNEEIRGAVTATSRDTIVNARRVDRDFIAVQRDQVREASVLRNPGMRPERNSVLGQHAADATQRTVPERAVITRATPPRERPQFDFGRGRDAAANADQRAATIDRSPVIDRARGGTPAQRAEGAAAAGPEVTDRVPRPGNREMRAGGNDAVAQRPAPEQRQFRYPRPPERASATVADETIGRPSRSAMGEPGTNDRGRMDRVPRPPEAGGAQPSRGPNVDRARGGRPADAPAPSSDNARVNRAPEPRNAPSRDAEAAPARSPERVPRPPQSQKDNNAPRAPQRENNTPQSERNDSPRSPQAFGFHSSPAQQPDRSYRAADAVPRPSASETPRWAAQPPRETYRAPARETPSYRAPAREAPSYSYRAPAREAPSYRAPAREAPSYRSAPSAPRSSGGGGYRGSSSAPSRGNSAAHSSPSSRGDRGSPRNH